MCHVLVIEDDPLIAMLIEDLAIEAGATSTEIAASPIEAVLSALAQPPAVILSDVAIVDGTGPEAVAVIRENLGSLPVIFITATPEECDRCDYAAAILTKPVSNAQLITAIRQAAPV